jgi:hypothetical protein
MIELDKKTVDYLHSKKCFTCRYSQVDPFDWGLRCCNSDSEHCTEYCPEVACEHLDIDEELSPRLKAVRDLSEAGKTPRDTKCDLSREEIDLLKFKGE